MVLFLVFTVIIIAAEFVYARETLIPAREVGLTNGDYAFIMFELDHDEVLLNKEFPSYRFTLPTNNDHYFRCKLQQAFESVLLIALNVNENKGAFKKFQRDVKRRSPDEPFNSTIYQGYIFDDPTQMLRNTTQVRLFTV